MWEYRKGSTDWAVEEERSSSKKMQAKFLVIDGILEDKHANCYTRLETTCLENWGTDRRDLNDAQGRLLVEIWEFGSLPWERFKGWLMGGSLGHALPYNKNNTEALPQWVPSWISYPERKTTTFIWFLATAWPNRKLVLMSTEFKLFVEGGSLASTQWVSRH